MPRDMSGTGRYPPVPKHQPTEFFGSVRLGDPERLCHVMSVDPYFITQDNGAGAPIHFATTYKQLDMIHHLLNNGAEINQRDDKGLTALHRAAHLAQYDGYLEIYEYLLVATRFQLCRTIMYLTYALSMLYSKLQLVQCWHGMNQARHIHNVCILPFVDTVSTMQSRGADPSILSDNFEPYLSPGRKAPVEVATDDEEVRHQLRALEKLYAQTPKCREPHPDIGCWQTLYDYGLDAVKSWATGYKHPYPGDTA